MKIGVCDRSASGWTSGSEYTRAQVAALLAVQEEYGFELHVVADTESPGMNIAGATVPITRPAQVEERSLFTRELDRMLNRTGIAAPTPLRRWREWARAERFDVLLSFIPPVGGWEPPNVATCAWVVDLQHDVLPEMFPEGHRLAVDAAFRDWAERCDLVVVSSEAAQRDFAHFLPQARERSRVYRFPSRFAFDESLTASTDLGGVLEKYHIDRDFLLVVNQFWKHKNHDAIVEAAGILKRTTGRCPMIVMIGLPFDDRDPGGAYLSRIFAGIAENGLEGCVKLLGFVSGVERDALFRSCTALIQPSRFEGWSTSIEDAKAIGRPVIASGLDVNREQLPDAFGFFDVDDPRQLADLIAAAAELPAGPDFVRERAALAASRESLVETGRELYAICQDAVAAAAARGATLPHAADTVTA